MLTTFRQDNMKRCIFNLIDLIGDNPEREGLKDTPKRVAKMYRELFWGYSVAKLPRIMKVRNGADGLNVRGMLIDKGPFISYCEHHMVPFFGYYFYGYIPDKWVAGASKIGRTVDYFSARLQIQERIAVQVLNRLESQLQPRGSIILLQARHLCKEMRGVKKWDSPYSYIETRGVFDINDAGCKDEFLTRIGVTL